MTPARAIAWEFGRRHRWGLAGIAAYLAALGIIRLFFLPHARIDLERPNGMWFLVLAPVVTIAIYFIAVFSFGLDGDLAARPSIYPRRLFTLPVTTAALAGWPMLCGATAAAGLWLTTALLGLRPSGIDAPLLWPALFAAAFLAWTQALTWMPYPIRGLRVIVALLWLTTADVVLLLALHHRVAGAPIAAAALAALALAYPAARLAVARARRGEAPDWFAARARRGRIAGLPALASPARAQLWFEWRRHGWSLPALVGILAPLELLLLFIPDVSRATVLLTLICVLLTPPLMAFFAAAAFREAGLTPFIATRPATSAALVGAKLATALWSTLVAWGLVLIAALLALSLSGTWPAVIRAARDLIDVFGAPRAAVLFLLILAALVASTWKQLVQTLYVGLTGRDWAARASVGFGLAVLCAVGPVAKWLDGDWSARGALWNALPSIVAVLAGLKTCAAVWVATRLHRSRLLPERVLVTGAASWAAAVLALYGLLSWLLSGPLVPQYFLLLLAILAVPIARLSAAPLALDWNRHR